MRSNRRSLRRSRRGFILLEVVLATTVFALVGVALVKAVGMTADTMHRSNRETRVRLGIESRISEALGERILPGVHKEEPGKDGVAYEEEWKAVQFVTQDKTSLSGLYQLTIRAHWTDDGADDAEEAQIRVYRPQL